MNHKVPVCIALGSNMGDRHGHLSSACAAIGRLPDTSLVQSSCFIETEPVGPIDQESFLNAAILIHTSLSPRQLLDALHVIEQEQGRQSEAIRVKWGPRPLDLDIIFYDQLICNEPGLIVPHPLMHERWFVLKPLSEIASDWVHPTLGQTVSQLLAKVNP